MGTQLVAVNYSSGCHPPRHGTVGSFLPGIVKWAGDTVLLNTVSLVKTEVLAPWWCWDRESRELKVGTWEGAESITDGYGWLLVQSQPNIYLMGVHYALGAALGA